MAIRGLTVFKVQRVDGSIGLSSGAMYCPRCQTLLTVLTNWWAFFGYLVAVLAGLAKLLIERTEHPALYLALALLVVLGFLLGIIAIIYLPRYSVARVSTLDLTKQ